MFFFIFLQKVHILFVLLLLISVCDVIFGYKILFLVPFPGGSHWLNLQNFAKELLNRGHEVTAIVNSAISNFTSPNYTEVLIRPAFDKYWLRMLQSIIITIILTKNTTNH